MRAGDHHIYRFFVSWQSSLLTSSTLIKSIVLLLLINPLTGCTHQINNDIRPALNVPETFSQPRQNLPPQTSWWKSFNDSYLDELIEQAFESSFTLKQAYARIMRAQLSSAQTATELYPTIDAGISLGSTWLSDGSARQKRYGANLNLSWEVDLWQRFSAAEKAAYYEAEATRDDWQAAAFLLTAKIAENYLQLIEQNLQLALLERQLEASETFLELIELRFAHGDASIVDIYQQRQQLAALKSQFPTVKNQILLNHNRLAVLLGNVPDSAGRPIADQLPELPPVVDIGIPGDLLLNRPDLRSIHNKLLAADYNVGVAVAERMPKITLSGTTGYSGAALTSDSFFTSIIGEIFAPLIDWQKRKREVSKRKYALDELLADYSQTFLVAIEETENGIWQENHQRELLDLLGNQLKIAQANLAETRNRYMQGLSDYLPVLSALQSVQRLEREMLIQDRQLLVSRVHLYRAIGGAELFAMPEKEQHP